jgi:cytochrome bd-type quinol oxidase subunit 1
LDKKLFENSRFIKGADISLTGRNLWIIHKNLPYADPEDIYSAGNVSGHQVVHILLFVHLVLMLN